MIFFSEIIPKIFPHIIPEDYQLENLLIILPQKVVSGFV